MARNNRWSNYRLLGACARLSQDEFEAPRTSFFPSIKATLNHILIVDWFYIDALAGGTLGQGAYVDEEPHATLASLGQAQFDSDVKLIKFCDALNDAAVEKATLLRGRSNIHQERAGEVLLHLFTHQIHHRGQTHAMLSGTAIAPPQLDEFFLDLDAPARSDEEAAMRDAYPANAHS